MSDWYPGHVARAASDALRLLKLVDVVIEVLDARAPAASRYGKRHALFTKKRAVVMTRADLADPQDTDRWLNVIRTQGQPALAFWLGKTSARDLYRIVREAHGREGPITCMAAGLPNVGKSTVLNVLAGKARARTGALPGITRGVQVIECPSGIRVLDLPGIVMPRRPPRPRMLLLAALGILPEAAVSAEDAATWLIEQLEELSPGLVASHYSLQDPVPDMLCQLAFRRGALLGGGEADVTRAARILLGDFCDGRLGRFTLEPVTAGG